TRVSGSVSVLFFFFQAEDGIRDWSVTGVQTCALPISRDAARAADGGLGIRLGARRLRARELRLAGGAHRDGGDRHAHLALDPLRSEERRVGKERRARGGAEKHRKKRRER